MTLSSGSRASSSVRAAHSTCSSRTRSIGRTPKLGRDNGGNITAANGRDHWAGVFSALFAGAGVVGGQVIGRSDKFGAYPASRGYYPSDLGATIYSVLGIDPSTAVQDTLGRPLELNRGEPIVPLFTGTTA